MRIDMFGKQCPLPVMEAKKAIDAGQAVIEVAVDNTTAVGNLTRLAERSGYAAANAPIEGGFLVSMTLDGDQQAGDGAGSTGGQEAAGAAASAAGSDCGACGCGTALFVGKDHLGEGDPVLGRNLIKMALLVESESELPPSSVLFMNSGVKLLCGEEPQVVESMKKLVNRGVEVLVCGTCLNFYGMGEKLEVGVVSNMYDILGRMHDAAKVITL